MCNCVYQQLSEKQVCQSFFSFSFFWCVTAKADCSAHMMKDRLLLCEVWIGMSVKGRMVKWSQANSAAVTICSAVKYVCYSNKHQPHQTKQMSWFLDTGLNYPKSNSGVIETALLRFINASLLVICDFLSESNMVHHKRQTNLFCKSSVSQTHARLNLKKAFKHIAPLIIEHCTALNCVSGWWIATWGEREDFFGLFVLKDKWLRNIQSI